MSKNITVSDEVYRRLKREKGDRSFSEVIDAKLDSGGTLAEISGQQMFDTETADHVNDEIESLSCGTVERIIDETA